MKGLGRHGVGAISHPLFILFLAVLVVAVALLTPWVGIAEGLLLGFDAAAFLFILGTCVSMGDSSAESLRKTAARNDANRTVLLLIVALLLLVILVALGFELGRTGRSRGIEILIVVPTLFIAWGFGNIVCALHYAHMYYDARPGGGDHAGLDFPGTKEPYFWDFCYFAFVLGMTFQVSDVQIESAPIRRTATMHGLLAFAFNIGVVAMTVNVVAGLV